ncbi:MAG: hypothetical protein VKM01_05235 [Cyanobacteriota bacterium]|jgi:hypothetical protein|nr:hypothetical protein [Cyanobacteriota bacterium]
MAAIPLLALLLAAALGLPPPATAGALRPVLMLMRPQLENRLAQLCLDTASGGRSDLARTLEDPCRKLAGPTSRCLVEETDASGRSLEVMGDVMASRFGPASEQVVKRCLERLFGLPANSLRPVPLQELGRRFAAAGGAMPAQTSGGRP